MNSLIIKMQVEIDYTNWRGERRTRLIIPKEIVFTHTQHHPKDQWLVEAFEVEGGPTKFFALNNIHSWRAAWPRST